MIAITAETLVSNLEAGYEEEQQASALKEQAKVIMAKKKERFTDFAKECEVDVKDINAAYARYKELKNGSAEVTDEDRYTLLALVDEAFQEEDKV